MPTYIFKHPDKEEYLEIFQNINDEHVYSDEEGVMWDRVFTSPNLSVDTNVDPFSQTAFLDKTTGKGTIGDLMDRSSELSQKRAEQNGGVDPIKKQYFKDYSKKRGGKKHEKDR